MQILDTLDTARALGEMGVGRAFIGFHAHVRKDPLAQLFTRKGRRDPYAIYERIRALGPFPTSSFNSIVLVDHARCHQVLRSRDFGVGGIPSPSRAVDLSLLILDPPDHTRLRRLISGAFAPSRMRAQEERIQQASDRLVEALATQLTHGPVDAIREYAKPLPIVMIAALMGIPDAELPALGDTVMRSAVCSMVCSRCGTIGTWPSPNATSGHCSTGWPAEAATTPAPM